MFVIIVKELWVKENGFLRDEIIFVVIMLCIVKIYEVLRLEFLVNMNYDVDYVIIIKEFIKIFKNFNIDLKNFKDEEIDLVMGEYIGVGIIFGRIGGVIEVVFRIVIENIIGKKIDNVEF